ncbi:hypothetical protein Tco_0896168, partial [Tanacetum coccineum]
EQFKVETGRIKRAPECMRISEFVHGVNNPELTKRFNEQVPKTMEEMMTVSTAFILGEAAAASKKKGHLPWKSHDQPKRHASEQKFDFRDHCTRAWMNFMIVRSMSPYNGIIGRSGIREIQAVPSTAHRMLKFPVDGGIVTIRSTILIPAKCATEVAIDIDRSTAISRQNTRLNYDGGIVTIRSTILIPAKCATVIISSKEIPKEAVVHHENLK